MRHRAHIDRLDAQEVIGIHADIVAIYRAAFTEAPFNDSEREVGWFGEELASDVRHPGFRCFVARVCSERAGFAYGFRTFTIDPWNDWYEEVLRSVGAVASDEWIRGQFAVGWFAVHPDRQGLGIGASLHDALVSSAVDSRWWLVTHDLETSARKLYRRRGWRELGRGPLGWGKAERLVLGLDPGQHAIGIERGLPEA